MSTSLKFWPFVAAMAIVVAASNFLVQFPFRHFGMDDILTWGAFTYPAAFLINDLTNRSFGMRAARIVIVVGFVIALALSLWLASPRIAVASGTAFLFAQLLDAGVFNRLRNLRWWKAPFVAGIAGAVLDTAIFFSIAFSSPTGFLDTSFGLEDNSLTMPVQFLGFGGEVPLWMSLAAGDFMVKVALGIVMLIPYRSVLGYLRPMALEPKPVKNRG